MRKHNIKNISVTLFSLSLFVVSSCGKNNNQGGKTKTTNQISTDTSDSEKKYKVTFIELGSVRCIPCQQMQIVMKSVEAKYGKEVKLTSMMFGLMMASHLVLNMVLRQSQPRCFLTKPGRNITGTKGFSRKKSW